MAILPNKPIHLQRGANAEHLAYQFLLAKGLKPVTRNFRCKLGEIDLIMEQGNTLVIVEVRYRKHTKFGSAEESITRKKQSRIIAATQYYLAGSRRNQAVRFDVIAITGNNPPNWIQNAFLTYT